MANYIAPYEGNEPFVFVSYAHKDSAVVLPLIRGLQTRGVRVWYDAGLEVGAEWPVKIADHLEKSYCVLAFVSRNFGDSYNCRREINFAIEERKEPVVIYLEPRENLNAGMRMQLGSLHAMFYDCYENTNAFLDVLIQAEILKPCIGAKPVEIHSEPKVIPFETIGFADEVETVSEVLPTEGSEDVRRREFFLRYLKAAEAGDPEAQFVVGGAYANGVGTEKNPVEKVKWLRKAAEQGHAAAQNYLGWAYFEGEDVRKDPAESVKWFSKAAEQGIPEAQFALGMYYETGLAVTRDMYKAVKWYSMAAGQGHAKAQYYLGLCYEHGTGVKKDLEKALVWYRKAKEKNVKGADTAIARCEAAQRKPWWKF